jgi:hypothetical protein
MKIRILFLYFYLFIFGQQLIGGQEDRLFYDAIRAEGSEDIDLAISLYLEASKLSHSTNLHGNLANLYFKKEQFGHAILHFRKALLLQPKNSELSANLEFAYEMAKIPRNSNNFLNTYLSPDFISFWVIISTVIFWGGLLFFLYFLFFKTSKKPLFYFVLFWIPLAILSFYPTVLCLNQKAELNQEVITHLPSIENNNSKSISLRRFAGEQSSANTTIIPGESLMINLAKDGGNKTHKSASGKIWYLARSKNGKKKGWLREDEFEWIVDQTTN